MDRLHHVLSLGERWFFYWMDWLRSIRDIREQYPLLPVWETVEIAEQHGLCHPRDRKTGEPIVMTTDFRLTEVTTGGLRELARSVKPKSGLTRQAIEKLEVERLYWQRRGIPWLLVVTEEDLPMDLCRNVEYVHRFFRPSSVSPLTAAEVARAADLVMHMASSGEILLGEAGHEVSSKLRCPLPLAMNVLRHLLATRQVEVDMHAPINPQTPLAIRRCQAFA